MSALDLADAKLYLRIDGTEDDVELQATIDSAEATIAERVGPLTASSITERVDSDGETLVLSTFPVLAITSVEAVGNGESIDPDDLYVDEEAGILSYADGVTAFRGRRYLVSYQAGFDQLPADLRNGVKELVRHRWLPQRGGLTRPGTAADSGDDETIDNLPATVYHLIEDYIIDDEQGFA